MSGTTETMKLSVSVWLHVCVHVIVLIIGRMKYYNIVLTDIINIHITC